MAVNSINGGLLHIAGYRGAYRYSGVGVFSLKYIVFRRIYLYLLAGYLKRRHQLEVPYLSHETLSSEATENVTALVRISPTFPRVLLSQSPIVTAQCKYRGTKLVADNFSHNSLHESFLPPNFLCFDPGYKTRYRELCH